MRVFVYGTLMNSALVARLIGRPASLQAATLRGFRRVRLSGSRFPTLVRGRGIVSGALLQLDRQGLRRVRAFEGPRYRLTRVYPKVGRGRAVVAAHAWIAAGATRQPWP